MTEENPPNAMVVCTAVAVAEWVVPGSQVIEDVNGHEVYISPATVKAREAGALGEEPRFYCMVCAQEAHDENAPVQAMPGAKDELIALGATEEDIAQMHDAVKRELRQ